MKFLRLLMPLVLLFIALPSFALCGPCEFNCNCTFMPGYGSNCRYDIDCCYERISTCFSDGSETAVPLSSEFTIASVEIVTPADVEQRNDIRLAEQQQKTEAVPVTVASITP